MADFHAVAEASVDELLELAPEEATDLGDHRFDDRVWDRSFAAADAAVRQLRARQRELQGVDQSTLDPESQVDAAMLTKQLALRIFSYEEIREPAWNPLVYNPGDGLFVLLAQDTQPPETRMRGVCGRLEAIPRTVELALQQLDNPPRIHVETALQQHPGVADLVRGDVARLLSQVTDLALRGRVERAQDRALSAWESFGRFLEESLEKASGDFRLGEPRFARKLGLYLQSPLSPEEVVRRAAAELAATTEELAEVAAELVGGGGSQHELIRRALDLVAEVRPSNETVLDEARSALAQLTAAVGSSGLFTVPDDPYDVELMPEFMRGSPPVGCWGAGPFEEGAHSKVMISPTPDDWPTERSQSFYREFNSADLVTDMAHEAMPGHVLQLSVARRFRGPSRVRVAFPNNPFMEGWACHAEQIVAGLGLGGLHVRSQQLKGQLINSVNAILDSAVHAGEMGEDEAITLITERGLQEPAVAQLKWRRACLTSGQLSTYFVGYTELQDLFESLAPIASYDEVLAHGSPPPSLLAGLLG
ncbi:MAG: DUF885 domain-containing protein [Candidatus Dormibacteria bacterium]